MYRLTSFMCRAPSCCLRYSGVLPDHQSADEHRKQRHHHQTVEPATGPAGSHFAQHHVQHQHRAPGAGEAVIGRVRRPVGAGGRDLTEQGAAGNSEPGFGAFERCPDSVRRRCRASGRSPPLSRPSPTTNRVAAAANSAQPCFLSPTITPNVRRNATGISSIATISTTFVNGVGFSNGCALLTLKAPPPSPDISLIDSHVATGPPRIVCLPPASVEISCAP